MKIIGDFVIEAVKSIDAKYYCEIMGSYKRKELLCGDIDVMISHPSQDYNGKSASIRVFNLNEYRNQLQSY